MTRSADLHTLGQSDDTRRSVRSECPGLDAAVPPPGSKWRTRLLLPSVVLAATVAVLGYAARDSFRPAVDVTVASVVPKSLAPTASDPGPAEGAPVDGEGNALAPANIDGADVVLAQAPGWIEPAPFAISVPALAEGVVREVLVLEGDSVDAGQVVATLISDDAALALRAGDATLAQRDADAARARAAVSTARAQVEIERANVAELQDEVSRRGALVGVGGVSAGEFRRLEIRLERAVATLAMSERLVDEARIAVVQADAGVVTATVARDEARLRFERMEVRSPSAGVVLSRLVEPGTRLSMGPSSGPASGQSNGQSSGTGSAMSGAVVRLYDPTSLQVRVDVTLADAAKITLGTAATITTDALPETVFHGTVTRVVHEANIQRNTVQFKVRLDNPSPVLKPEMLTRVKFHAPRGGTDPAGPVSSASALLIPLASLTDVGEGTASVWVVDTTRGTPAARRQAITTGASHEEGFVIATGGVQITDRVVLDPPASLREGVRLRLRDHRPN